MLQGSIVALVTPMTAVGELDWAALENLVDWHIEQGTKGFVIAGSTGEGATLTHMERAEMIRRVAGQVQGQVPVIAGTGTNSTATSCELTREAKSFGANAALAVVPYYNKPTQEGLISHFREIAKEGLPVILYNHPGRTGIDMQLETVKQLATDPNIVAIKEAGSLDRIKHLLEQLPPEFKVYCGNDPDAVASVQAGGAGIISVAANVVPRLMSKLMDRALEGKPDAALAQQLQPLFDAMVVETNPIPVKWALADMGRIKSGIRLPLLPLSERFHAQVRTAVQAIQGELA